MLGKQFCRLHKRNTQRFRMKVFVFATVCGLVVAQSEPKYHGNPDSMVFPGPLNSRSREVPVEVPAGPIQPSKITKSIQLAQEINSVQSVEEFLKLVHGVPETEKHFLIGSRFGEGEERSKAERPIRAQCMPEPQPVSLKQDNDTSTIYYPPCTRINRCGGCCSNSLLSCQPVASEIRNFEVFVTTIEDNTGLSYRGKLIVPLEEHTKCKCDCRIKPEHCTEKQSYRPHECSCVCNNVDEAEKCARNNDTKLWDPNVCACFCRSVQECNTGYYFDHNTCRCELKE